MFKLLTNARPAAALGSAFMLSQSSPPWDYLTSTVGSPTRTGNGTEVPCAPVATPPIGQGCDLLERTGIVPRDRWKEGRSTTAEKTLVRANCSSSPRRGRGA